MLWLPSSSVFKAVGGLPSGSNVAASNCEALCFYLEDSGGPNHGKVTVAKETFMSRPH